LAGFSESGVFLQVLGKPGPHIPRDPLNTRSIGPNQPQQIPATGCVGFPRVLSCAVALTRGRGDKSETDYLEEAFTFLRDAVSHAVTAIQIVVNVYLFNRFK